MNIKLANLFNELTRPSDKFHSYEDLAYIFHVSSRTIRNHCILLMDHSEKLGYSNLFHVGANGITYKGTQKQSLALRKSFGDCNLYEYRLSHDERVLAISIILLLNDSKVTASTLSEILYTSRATIVKDMDDVKRLLLEYDIFIEQQTKRGYYLNIPESLRRDTVASLFNSDLLYSNRFAYNYEVSNPILNEITSINTYISYSYECLQSIEEKYNILISDSYFHKMAVNLSLIVDRLVTQHYLEDDYFSYENKNNPTENELSIEILSKVGTHFDIVFSYSEVKYLTSCMHRNQFERLSDLICPIDIHFYLAAYFFINKIENQLSIGLNKNQTLVFAITRYIQTICKPSDSKNLLESCKFDIDNAYSEVYNVVEKNIFIINNCIGRKCSIDEIYYIVMCIVFCTDDQIINHKKNRPRVFLICHAGIGTSHYLAHKLLDIFNMDIVGIESVHKLPSISKTPCYDLLISTIPLDDDIEHIYISPELTQNDISLLANAVTTFSISKGISNNYIEKPQRCKFDFTTYIKPEYIILDEPCKDWRDAIRISTFPLISTGKVTNEYANAIVKSIESFGPYFVFSKGVALAHASPKDGVKEFCCSLLRPASPVKFNHEFNDPVRLIVTIGIDNIDLQKDFIANIMQCLSSESFVDDIMNAKNINQVVQLFE